MAGWLPMLLIAWKYPNHAHVSQMMPTFARRFGLFSASGAYAAFLVLIRGRPSLEGDGGIFLSVAGRLLHGDRLYVDVVDNKDPLFYYAHAGALAIGDWRGPFLLDVLWLAVAAASAVLLLRAIGATRLTVLVGFVSFPLLLTGATWYAAGYSMLAALAIAPLIGWLWIRGNFGLAGALLGVGLLFKVNLALVLVSAPLAFLLLRRPAGSVWSQVAKAAAGLGAVLVTAAVILAFRRELHGYLEMLTDNIAYSRDVLAATPGRPTGILGHMEVAAQNAAEGALAFAFVAIAFLLVGLLAVWALRGHRQDRPGTFDMPGIRGLAALFLLTTAAASITLALTAAWSSHSQMLAYPGFLLIAFVLMVIRRLASLPTVVAGCVAASLVVVLLGGAVSRPVFISDGHAPGGSISTWLEMDESETADLLERAAADRTTQPDEKTFAHLGQNDEEAVGAFLDQEFLLACPAIAQYVFSPDLPDVLRCIREEHPSLLLITPSFRFSNDTTAEWNQFVARGTALLRREYAPVLRYKSSIQEARARAGIQPHGPIMVWALRESSLGSPEVAYEGQDSPSHASAEQGSARSERYESASSR